MKLSIICCIYFVAAFFIPWFASAQFSFDVNSQYCLEERITLAAKNQPFDQVEWDFCVEKFSDILTTDLIATIPPAGNRNLGIDFTKVEGIWYAMLTNWSSNKLIRLTFGEGLESPPTSIVDLGNPGGLLNQPASIALIQENGYVYALIQNWGNSNLIRIRFDDGISGSTVIADVAYSSFGASLSKMDLINEGGELKAIAITPSTSIHVVDFRNSIENEILSANVMVTPPIPGVSATRSIDMIKHEGDWFAFVASFSSGVVARVNFGTDIMSGVKSSEANVTTNLYGGGSVNNIQLIRNGPEFHLHVATFQGRLFKVNLEENIEVSGISSGAIEYSNSTNYQQGYTFKFVRESARWIGFIMNDVASRLYRISNTSQCFAIPAYSDEPNTVVSFAQAEDHIIELRSFDNHDNSQSVFAPVTIITAVAPDIAFIAQNVCQENDIIFSAESSSQDIVTFAWDFGDGFVTSTSLPTQTHQYTLPGTYPVSITVTTSSGCSNVFDSPWTVYPPPDADFALPTGLICTNTTQTITNLLDDTFDGHLTYQWYIDNELAGSERDLEHSFTTTGPKEIKLITSIPGCSNEETKITPDVQAGPLIDFSFEGQCATEEVSFTTEVSEVVTDHFWSFDDGSVSAEIDPSHQFDYSGTYQVTLTATSSNGCNNSSTQEVTIFSKPTPDFSIHPPPLACSGVATPFSDLTPDPLDSDIESWLWQFGESIETASTRDAEFIFANAGEYDVSLTVTSDAGCEASVNKPVAIFPSPVAEISRTPACLGKPTTFTAIGDGIQSYYWETGTSYYETSEITHAFQNPGEHPLMLTVYGENNCVTTYDHIVNVPQQITPDFSFINHCVGYETAFNDITPDNNDPIVSREWNFAGMLGENSAAPTHVFNLAGEQNVRLMVTTGSGCIYSAEKTINVLPPPVASFTASPETGAAPLAVQFTNTSTSASEWVWTFDDQTGTTSTDQSPNHTFAQVGDYEVELLARNAAGCESRFEKTFTVVTALPDVNVKLISTTENSDGSIKVIITLENKGNTFIEDLPVEIDISGNASLTEIVEGPIAPGTLYNLVLSYSINRVNNLSFLCADASLENDLAPDGNRMCFQFNHSIFIFYPYPNPAADNVTFEWLSPTESEITIQLADSFGKTMLFQKVGATIGLNQHQIDVSGLKPGVYFIILKEREIVKTHRIVVSRQN